MATRPPLRRIFWAQTSEIRRWVLQFGAEAEVLKPASLRRAVMQELAAAAKAYRGRRGSEAEGK